MALTAHSTIGEWLNDEVGNKLVTGLLAQSGASADSGSRGHADCGSGPEPSDHGCIVGERHRHVR